MPNTHPPVLPEKLPKHVAIIMDGNGRWAKAHGLPRTMGHRQGVIALRPIIEACGEWGIPYLTMFAFSTENWQRPAEEVNALMALVEEFFYREIDELHQKGVQINILGDLSALPERPRGFIERAVERTRNNTVLHLNLALNYGGRDDIARAARLIAQEAAQGKLDPSAVNEDVLAAHLYTAGLPEVDLLIRTANEYRLSNFLLYQIAYAELVIDPSPWPQFDQAHFADALREYASRQRRFGALPT